MFTTITIKGLGLDESLDLQVSQHTHIRRRSMGGKTRVARGLLLLLTGREPWGAYPSPRDGQSIYIQATTRTMVLERTIERDKRGNLQHSRRLTVNGDEQDVSSEKRWAEALGSVGHGYGDPEVIRLVCWPLYWRDLLGRDKDGRALRDALLGCLDTEAQIAKIVKAAPCWKDGDPLTEKAATEARKLANKNRDAAAGRHQEALAALQRLQPVQRPDDGDLERARLTLAQRSAWDAFEGYMDRYDAWCSWHDRRKRLGERPVCPTEDTLAMAQESADAAAKKRAEAWQRVDGGQNLVREARRMLEIAERERAALPPAPAITETCPTCGQAWDEAEATTTAAHDAWLDEQQRLDAEVAKRAEMVTEAEQALDAARGSSTLAEIEYDQRAEELRELQAAVAAYAEWGEKLSMLGPEPVEPLPIVEQPAGVPPTPLSVAGARQMVEQAQRAEGAAGLRDGDREQAQKALEAAEAKAAATAAEAGRLDDLVTAIREAPSQLLPYAIEALGDTGPALVTSSGSSVDVLVNGHPWQEASEGELRHADAHLRLAIRRAYGVRWLPIIVEQAQDWSEPWDIEQGPIYFLWTERPAAVLR